MSEGWNDMHKAVVFEKVDLLIELLREGTDPNVRTPSGNTPLHLACLDGLVMYAEILINNGADIDAKNEDGETPLHWAVHGGSAETVRLLIEAGAVVDATTELLETPLHWAIACEDLEDNEIAKMLLLHGADPFAENYEEGNCAMVAARHNNLEMLGMIITAHRPILTETDDDGNTLLHLAAAAGHLRVVNLLLCAGINPKTKNDDDNSAAKVADNKEIRKAIRTFISLRKKPAHSPLRRPRTSSFIEAEQNANRCVSC
eukprot:TRINITY_DN260_c0_g1_i2.p1 TRINITY_DN260_c0_g1~~TRINITY_DN260_c0_g1_i2.p1  ORF type:complete len:259 (+),score=125.61 TRINITY_DN260_c0_g1_i2:196-972(+)